jgi:hypothetical protein
MIAAHGRERRGGGMKRLNLVILLVLNLAATACSCSLGPITHALYEVGGQYRRSM